MEDIYHILEIIQQLNQRAALATIIHVEGSAYLREGTAMLIAEDGTQTGMISAGCLDADLKICAKDVWDEEKAQTISYDMQSEDDLSWGQGAGCNGVIYILIEPLSPRLKNNLKMIKKCLETGIQVIEVKEFTNQLEQLDCYFRTSDGFIFGKENAAPYYRYPSLPKNMDSGIQYNQELSTLVYYHEYTPKPRLIIFGAGYDARPLANFASETGFSVTICDWRPSFCEKSFFPLSTQIIVGFPEKVFVQVNIKKDDFVVIMTHEFQKDLQILSLLKGKDVRYVGLLGSKRRSEKLIEQTQIGIKIHTPVGISLGAKGPTEIAISIVAQMIQILRSEASVS